MSNRDLEIAVNAEGVDDAAGEMDQAVTGGDAEVSGAGGRGGGLKGALAGGLLGGLLSQLDSVTAIVDAILGLLNAFLAPLAIMALRLLQPVLQRLLGILPDWLAFLDMPLEQQLKQLLLRASTFVAVLVLVYNAAVGIWNWLRGAPGEIAAAVGNIADWTGLVSDIRNLPRDLWGFISRLPSQIGAAIDRRLPSIGGLGGGGGDDSSGLFDRFNPFDRPGGGGGGGGGGFFESINPFDRPGGGDGSDPPIITFEGGAGAFIDGITENSSVDWP